MKTTHISPMLAVSNAASAIEFYKAAFGAEERWRNDATGSIVAGLAVDGANFFLAEESPSYGTRSPLSVGTTTVRIELFVDDPAAVFARAVAAGATELNPVQEHHHTLSGPHPINHMVQGAVRDPFGHIWLIGRVLE